MINYKNLDECAAFARLKSLPRLSVGSLLSPERISASMVDMAAGLSYSYAATPIDEEIIDCLESLAGEQQLLEKYQALLSGAVMNTGEGRMVLHHLARGRLGDSVGALGTDLRAFYEGERLKAADFARAVHAAAIRGSSGKAFKSAVQIGIGGSDLGPRAACLALERWARAEGRQKMRAAFISNVDPDDADMLLGSLDLETSLFILVSKSGTTQETLANETLVRTRLEAAGLDSSKHIVAVTSKTSPL
ncbi:MAG: glucose-6-phosphate isomerase, partial [Spirochaetia bacterium]|nr:glucose-6-phosphate isomerase [Spirochaetia bacterium]